MGPTVLVLGRRCDGRDRLCVSGFGALFFLWRILRDLSMDAYRYALMDG
jgi:hypothetical protein